MLRAEGGMWYMTRWKAFQFKGGIHLVNTKQVAWPHSLLPNSPKATLSCISAEPLGGAEGKTLFFHWRT